MFHVEHWITWHLGQKPVARRWSARTPTRQWHFGQYVGGNFPPLCRVSEYLSATVQLWL